MKNIFRYMLPLALPFMMASCSYSEKSDVGNVVSGKGGSLARFTITGEYLYTVDQSSLRR